MKTKLLLLLITALAVVAPKAVALITEHGREPIHTNWYEGVDAIVNHPARVSGRIGPFGPTSRFHYMGDVAVFNDVLALYGKITQKGLTVYLLSEAAPSVRGFKEGESHDFDVTITLEGNCFVHLYTMGRIRLEDLKIPDGIKIEALPPVGLPIDESQRAKIQAEQKRVAAFIAAHRAKSPPAQPESPAEIKL